MNKIIYFVCGLIVFTSCGRENAREEHSSKGRIEISPYKVTEVILKDTMQVKTAYAKCDSGRATLYEFAQDYCNPHMYLNAQQFGEFQKAIWMMVREPKSKIYKAVDAPQMTTKDMRYMFRKCDSMQQISYDPKGNEVTNTVFVCDSTSLVDQVNKIVFYESWYFNPANNMIERDVLGYAVWSYMMDKEAWRELFFVFRDEESLKKVKKYW
jgi:hypothetical protein